MLLNTARTERVKTNLSYNMHCRFARMSGSYICHFLPYHKNTFWFFFLEFSMNISLDYHFYTTAQPANQYWNLSARPVLS